MYVSIINKGWCTLYFWTSGKYTSEFSVLCTFRNFLKFFSKKHVFLEKNKKKIDTGFEPGNLKKYIKNISNVLKIFITNVLFFILIIVK